MPGEQQNEVKDYTLTELDTAVAQGSITQQQRDQIWADQNRKESARIATETTRKVVQEESRNDRLDRDLKQYVELFPELDKDHSDIRNKVAAEFDLLVGQGLDPKSLSTEFAAVRAALGPIERVRAIREGRRRDPDAFGDSQGARQLSPQQQREDDAWGKLSSRQREHYEGAMRSNVYPDRKACLAELKRSSARRQGRAA